MTEKRFKVAVYDEKAINGFAVLDLHKPNISKRLKYENVYIGSKAGCEIVCNFGNSLADENKQLKKQLDETIDGLYKQITSSENAFEGLMKENKELRDACKNYDWYKLYNQLRNENEKLKKALWCIRKRYGYTIEEFVEDLKDNGTDLTKVDLE